MKPAFGILAGMILIFMAVHGAWAQPAYTILHNFAGPPADGLQPQAGLVSDGSKLYGTTFYGGAGSGGGLYYGTVFSMNTDGSAYTLLHSFIGGANDGMFPLCALCSDDSKLYGTTSYGGTALWGTVFSINSNGSGFTILHNFTGPPDGLRPVGGLISDGNKLYGTTISGGAGSGGGSYFGTVFSLNKDGTGYAVLHNFIGGVNDGHSPIINLLLEGTTLYGITVEGGSGPAPQGLGIVFSMQSNGAGFTILRSFAGSPTDGSSPSGTLVSDGTRLYGTTWNGGTGWTGGLYDGTIFSMNLDGSAYTILHNFVSGPYDGSLPVGGLTLERSALYGTARRGGASDDGVIFSINTDGSDFTILHHFSGLPGDGRTPRGTLISDGILLYGTSLLGGSSDYGTVFSQALPTPVPNYINLAVSPETVPAGAQVTITYTCDFSQWDYRNQPVDVYLAAIRSPLVSDGPGSVDEALGGGTIYGYNRGMRSVAPGVRQPTWTRVTFPPVATTGTVKTTVPGPAGNWVFATAFRYSNTTIWVRSDGEPVENSNLITQQ
jgi:uncharacterized repeat protein (TIGR03803 family)